MWWHSVDVPRGECAVGPAGCVANNRRAGDSGPAAQSPGPHSAAGPGATGEERPRPGRAEGRTRRRRETRGGSCISGRGVSAMFYV